MGYPPKKATPELVKSTIENIRRLLSEGDGIVLSRRKSGLSNYCTDLSKQVTHSPEYIKMLNEYMVRIGKPVKYELRSGKLVRI